ncbi:MAG: single-stranded DNA-binding protein [Lachnospiraceae bacterium]|nr:single-stranded DNA-binding protein [Lachnospiraceae bacterium]
MNSVVLMGRLTRDPEVRFRQGQEQLCIARYTLAVDRPRRQGQEQQADFISCVAFGRLGEFAEKYLKKGTKICISGHIQTGSYTNRDGVKVYTTDVIADHQEFAESRGDGSDNGQQAQREDLPDGFRDIPAGIEEELPFC